MQAKREAKREREKQREQEEVAATTLPSNDSAFVFGPRDTLDGATLGGLPLETARHVFGSQVVDAAVHDAVKAATGGRASADPRSAAAIYFEQTSPVRLLAERERHGVAVPPDTSALQSAPLWHGHVPLPLRPLPISTVKAEQARREEAELAKMTTDVWSRVGAYCDTDPDKVTELWRTLERANLVALTVDARAPSVHASAALAHAAAVHVGLPVILAVTKCDALPAEHRAHLLAEWTALLRSLSRRMLAAAFGDPPARTRQANVDEDEPVFADVIYLEVAEAARRLGRAKRAVDLDREAEEEAERDDGPATDQPTPETAFSSASVDKLWSILARLAPSLSPPRYEFDDGLDHRSAATKTQASEDGAVFLAIVGPPNTGKSSLVNALAREKKVHVSSLPGKTKHLQTLRIRPRTPADPPLTIIDSRGFVAPRVGLSPAASLLFGLEPASRSPNPYPAVRALASSTDLLDHYNLPDITPPAAFTPYAVCEALATKRGWILASSARPAAHRAALAIISDFQTGAIKVGWAPRDEDREEGWCLGRSACGGGGGGLGAYSAGIEDVGRSTSLGGGWEQPRDAGEGDAGAAASDVSTSSSDGSSGLAAAGAAAVASATTTTPPRRTKGKGKGRRAGAVRAATPVGGSSSKGRTLARQDSFVSTTTADDEAAEDSGTSLSGALAGGKAGQPAVGPTTFGHAARTSLMNLSDESSDEGLGATRSLSTDGGVGRRRTAQPGRSGTPSTVRRPRRGGVGSTIRGQVSDTESEDSAEAATFSDSES